jgi:hypothetical protein
MLPEFGSRMQPMTLSNVLLPDPLGPRSPITVSGKMTSATSRSASTRVGPALAQRDPGRTVPGFRCAPRKGADDQWRKDPPRELSVALVADERLGAGAWPKPRDKGRLGRLSNPTGRNVSEALAGLESEVADADPPAKWGRPRERGSNRYMHPSRSAEVMGTARREGDPGNEGGRSRRG